MRATLWVFAFIAVGASAFADDVQLSDREIPQALVSGSGWHFAKNYFGKTSAKNVFKLNSEMPKDALPVIYNTRSHRFATVMGELLIRLKNPKTAKTLCRQYALDCAIGNVVVARPLGADFARLLEVGERLSKDPHVQIVQLNLGGNRWAAQ